ncbi:MAG: hypothetical protein MZV70_75545 [Desulfobacterales bacterium]|nr:hypothetical protein [Desulfobacterales bacterium]
MNVILVGMNHKTAPLEIRERLSFACGDGVRAPRGDPQCDGRQGGPLPVDVQPGGGPGPCRGHGRGHRPGEGLHPAPRQPRCRRAGDAASTSTAAAKPCATSSG